MSNFVRVESKSRVFYGWWIVLAGLALLICSGSVRVAIVTILIPRFIDLGYSHTDAANASSTFALLSLTSSFYLLAVGPIIDKYGPRKVMLVGIPIASIGFISLGFVNSIVTFLVLAGTLFYCGMAAGFGLAVYTTVANWFRKRRTIALAIIFAIMTLSGSITGVGAVIMGSAYDQFGSYQVGFIGLGTLMLVIGIPLALLFRHKPEQYGYLPDGQVPPTEPENTALTTQQNHSTEVNLTLRKALKSRAFWLLSVALALDYFVVGIIPSLRYQADLVNSNLLSISDNTWRLIFSLVGILLFGFLGDKYSKRHLLATAAILRCISVIILLSVGSIQYYVHGLLFYMGASIQVLTYAIIADYFGRRSFATIVAFSGIIRLIIRIPISWGLWFPIGWLVRISDNTYPAIAVTVAVGTVSAVLFLLTKPPRDETREEIITNIS